MPRKPQKPCRHPGCPELTNEQYCPAHKKTVTAQYNRYGRTPQTNKRYDKRWRKIRDAYIAKNPLCEVCKSEGKLIPAEIVHHKIELTQGGTHDDGNLQSLCTHCHASEHMKRRYDNSGK